MSGYHDDEQRIQEDCLWPWLADDSMADGACEGMRPWYGDYVDVFDGPDDGPDEGMAPDGVFVDVERQDDPWEDDDDCFDSETDF